MVVCPGIPLVIHWVARAMGHARVDNRTAFAFEALHLVDEDFRPLLVTLVKGTFDIGANGTCPRADMQIAPNLSGACWGEDPAESSYKYEPEVAFVKPATDVVVIGHAYAPRAGTTQMQVAVRVGQLSKQALVFGERVWCRIAGTVTASDPLAFEKMPLVYERAYGGWDRSHADPNQHAFEPCNPVGTGFRARGGFEEGIRLPNVEDPQAPVQSLGDRPRPTGFGFVSPHWQPRAALAGTYDKAWSVDRAPFLPKDFDRRHLNAGSAGLIAPGYLRGDEAVVALGMTPEGVLSFSLPGTLPPAVRVVAHGNEPKAVALNLDTVILEPDERRVILLWRGHLGLRSGPHDVREIIVC